MEVDRRDEPVRPFDRMSTHRKNRSEAEAWALEVNSIPSVAVLDEATGRWRVPCEHGNWTDAACSECDAEEAEQEEYERFLEANGL